MQNNEEMNIEKEGNLFNAEYIIEKFRTAKSENAARELFSELFDELEENLPENKDEIGLLIFKEHSKALARIEEERQKNIKEENDKKEQQKFEEMKKTYDSLSPLKKAWYKMTKKMVNQNGTWIGDEELGDVNGRSIK